jgi:hypothetical protein
MTDKPRQFTPDALLKATKKADIVEVPSRLVLSIEGAGPPDLPGFGDAIGALYGISYTMRFARKKGGRPVFKVGVLECEWWAEGENLPVHEVPARDTWRWRAMMGVPDDTSQEEVASTVTSATTKRGGKLEGSEVALRIELTKKEATRYARILHVGPYATEPESFAKIDEFLAAEGEQRERAHLEVYLSDPNRTAPDKLKTALLTRLL